MMFLPAHTKVFLALGHTDMRKSIDSLCVLVESVLGMSSLVRASVCFLQSQM
jgi:hypothetical protein